MSTTCPGWAAACSRGRRRLRIRDVTALAQPVTVYEGPLAPMPERRLGQFAPGEAREYEFVATLPEGGPPPGPASGDNAVQGATTVAYSWGAGEPEGAGGAAGDGLDVTIVKVRAVKRRGLLVVLGRCDEPCTAVARGRFKVLRHSRGFQGFAARRTSPRPLAAGPDSPPARANALPGAEDDPPRHSATRQARGRAPSPRQDRCRRPRPRPPHRPPADQALARSARCARRRASCAAAEPPSRPGRRGRRRSGGRRSAASGPSRR